MVDLAIFERQDGFVRNPILDAWLMEFQKSVSLIQDLRKEHGLAEDLCVRHKETAEYAYY